MIRRFGVIASFLVLCGSTVCAQKPEKFYDFSQDGVTPVMAADICATSEAVYFVGYTAHSGNQLFVLKNGQSKQVTHFEREYPDPDKKRKTISYFGGEIFDIKGQGSEVFVSARDRSGLAWYKVVGDSAVVRVEGKPGHDSRSVFPIDVRPGSGIWNTKEKKLTSLYPGKGVIGETEVAYRNPRLYFNSEVKDRSLLSFVESTGESGQITPYESPELGDVRDMMVVNDVVVFLGRSVKDDRFQLGQVMANHYVMFSFWQIRNVYRMFVWKNDLMLLCEDRYGHMTLCKYVPVPAPDLKDTTFVVWNRTYSGKVIGKVSTTDSQQRDLTYELVEGVEGVQGVESKHEIFEIDRYDGEIRVKNPEKLAKLDTGRVNIEVRVRNRELFGQRAIGLDIRNTPDFDRSNVKERLMFFPDFNQKNVLTTSLLSDGDIVRVYNFDLTFVDEIRVRDGKVTLGDYPSGYYILNSQNKERNYIQKIAVN